MIWIAYTYVNLLEVSKTFAETPTVSQTALEATSVSFVTDKPTVVSTDQSTTPTNIKRSCFVLCMELAMFFLNSGLVPPRLEFSCKGTEK